MTDVQKQKEKVKSFISQGEIINQKERHIPSKGMIIPEYVSGPLLDQWISEINIFNERYLIKHPLYNSIKDICLKYKKIFSPCEDMIGLLKALLADDEFWIDLNSKFESSINQNDKSTDKEKLLTVLLNIYNNSDEEIYLSDNDNRLPDIKDYRKVIRQLDREGYFEVCKEDVIGGFEIELSDKALNNEKKQVYDANASSAGITNIYFSGNVNGSNISTGSDIKQTLSNTVNNSQSESKSRFEKYGIPIIVALIAAIATIIAACIGIIK